MKVIVPIKEYPLFIEYHVYEKDILGHMKFLYREIYNKDLVTMDIYKKLLRHDRTLEYLEQQLELLMLLNEDEKLINAIQVIIEKLTKDETVIQ